MRRLCLCELPVRAADGECGHCHGIRLCACTNPLQDTAPGELRRCERCGAIVTPRDNALSVTDAQRTVRRLRSLLAKAEEDYPKAFDAAAFPRRAGNGGGRPSDVSDPTGSAVADPRRQLAAIHVVLATRALRRAETALVRVDEALGDVFLAIDTGPPVNHYDQYWPRSETDAELEKLREYAAKRRAAGEL